MKAKKILIGMLSGAIAISSMCVSASAYDSNTSVPNSDESKENVRVVYDGNLGAEKEKIVEFNLYELGKSIEGSKLRFSYVSGIDAGETVIEIATHATDWKWVSSENNFISEGINKETVIEMTYDEFVDFTDCTQPNTLSFIFKNWGLKKDSDFKIELITPVVPETTNTLVEGNVDDVFNHEVMLSPFEMGKDIENSKIQITFTPNNVQSAMSVGISGKVRDTWDWVETGIALYSSGNGQECVYTFTYEDFVEYAGIGDNLACFEFQNWGLKENTNFKIELITPIINQNVQTLFDGKINLTMLTPEELGQDIEGAKIRITYVADKPSTYVVLGVSGIEFDTGEWLQEDNGLLSRGEGIESTYTFTYNDFVEYAGIGDDLEYFVFQNWGLGNNGYCLIELLTPITVLYDDVIPQWDNVQFTPAQLGKGDENSKIRITYVPSEQASIGQGVIGITGRAHNNSWIQAPNNPALVKNNNGQNTVELTYEELVKLANIDESKLSYYIFSNWKLKEGTNVKIELITTV